MKVSTDRKILEAARECSDAYHIEAHQEGIETVADWKEVAFFIQGADWMKKKMADRACRYLRKRLGGKLITTPDKELINDLRKAMEEPL